MTNPIEQKLIFSEDTAARKKLIGGIEAIAEQQKKLSIEFAKGKVSTKDYTDSLAKLNRESTTLKKALAPLQKELDENRKATLAAEKAAEAEAVALRETAEAAEKAAAALAELEAKRKQATDAAISGIGGSIGGLKGAAGALGIGQLAAPLEIAEGFTQLTQAGKALGAQLSTISVSAAQAIPGLTGSAAGLVAVGAAALPIAAIVGAAAFAIYDYNKAAQEQAKELERVIVGIRNVNQDIAGGLTTEEAQARIEELTRQREAEAQTLATLQGAYDSMESQFRESLGIFAGPVLTGVKTFSAQEETLYQNIQTSNQALADMDAEINSLQRAITNNSLAANDAAATLEQLKEAETELSNERLQATQELTASLSRISQANEQIATLQADRARREAEAAEISALQQSFADEDEQAEQAQHYANLVSIARDGRQKIEAIQADLSKLATDRQAKLTEIETAGQSKIAKLNSSYMEKALADSRAFAKETSRIESDTAKARLRLIRSINQQLSDAEGENNVLEFLRIQRDGQQQLKDSAIDAAEAERRRVEDFNAKQAEAAELQRQRLNEALQQIEADKQATIQSFNEKRQALVDSIATEKQAIAERTAAAVESYAKSEALERQQADRQEQLQNLRDKHETDAFNRQIMAIEQRRDAELAMYAEIQNRIASIGQQLRSNLQAQTSAQSTTSGSSSSSSPFSGGLSYSDRARAERAGITAFADGGIVDKPTLALIGERAGMKELVMPFKSSEGIPAAFARHGMGSSSNPITISAPINLNLSVGDIATAGMVRREVEQAVETVLYDAIQPLLLNSLAGNT